MKQYKLPQLKKGCKSDDIIKELESSGLSKLDIEEGIKDLKKLSKGEIESTYAGICSNIHCGSSVVKALVMFWPKMGFTRECRSVPIEGSIMGFIASKEASTLWTGDSLKKRMSLVRFLIKSLEWYLYGR